MSIDQTPSTIRDQIAGVPVVEIARRFGTPTYVYDAAMITRRLQDLAAFDVVRYAQKACSNIAIVDWIRRQGGLVDTVSAGEIHRAIRAGYQPGGSPPPIVYTADIFDREALELVIEHDLHVNCGSPDMIDQYGQRMPDRSITLRINPGFGHGHSQKTNTGGKQSKHGIWYEQIGDCIELSGKHQLTISGIHLHIGSGTDLEHLKRVCSSIGDFARQVGPSIQSISVGGGLPIAYKPGDQVVDVAAYFQLCDSTRKELESEFNHSLSLEIEPGRYLVGECGYLVGEIRAIKPMDDNTFYLLDAGFNNLARPVLYGAYHPMSICSPKGSASDQTQPVVVGGPLCESGDIFTQTEGGFVERRQLPVATVGDFLVIECAGAYGYVMASNYNTKPLAPEVLIVDGQAHQIRARQSYDQMLANESIPA